MHLYYKYKFNIENITIERKRKEGKDLRDEKRLNLFFKIYCYILYPKISNLKMNNILIKLKESNKNFKNNIENIKNFKVIEKHF